MSVRLGVRHNVSRPVRNDMTRTSMTRCSIHNTTSKPLVGLCVTRREAFGPELRSVFLPQCDHAPRFVLDANTEHSMTMTEGASMFLAVAIVLSWLSSPQPLEQARRCLEIARHDLRLWLPAVIHLGCFFGRGGQDLYRQWELSLVRHPEPIFHDVPHVLVLNVESYTLWRVLGRRLCHSSQPWNVASRSLNPGNNRFLCLRDR